MGFPATDRGGSLEAQSYYAPAQPAYWLSVQGGWVDRAGRAPVSADQLFNDMTEPSMGADKLRMAMPLGPRQL